ncbi:istB-like ATP binding family protein [Escherichia coli 3-020-07_S3_C2]|nr:istB-like ATP binding family protein [Escherichia coli 3-020-07_S3_C2]
MNRRYGHHGRRPTAGLSGFYRCPAPGPGRGYHQHGLYRVIVVDDLGYVKRDSAETGVLFELIAHRYERGSLVITSNHPFSMWGSIFVDETMAVAAADRLIHHGYMFELKGESYRKKTAKAVTSVT